MDQKKDINKKTAPYRDNFEHLADELKKVDLFIQRRVMAFRQRNLKMREISVNRQNYVSHEEVDYLLQEKEGVGIGGDWAELARVGRQIETLQQEIDTRVSASMEAGVFLALPQLARLFNLSPFEVQVVVICLAPELRRKYDKIFVYLQDDIARKKPSIDLVLDLLCETEAEKWGARTLFSPQAPLFQWEIVQVIDDPRNPSGSGNLSRFLKLDPRILNFLMGDNSIDSRLSNPDTNMANLYKSSLSLDSVLIDRGVKDRVMNIINGHLALPGPYRKKLVLHFYGPPGVGKRELALGICRQLNCFLLYLDLEPLLARESGAEPGTLMRLAFREGLLLQALLYFDNMDVLLSGDIRSNVLLKSLSQMAAGYGWITILAGEKSWCPGGLFEAVVFHGVRLTVPTVELRQKAWENVLDNTKITGRDKTAWAPELARQFRLTPARIHDAVEFARYRYVIGNKQTQLTLEDLYAACRSQSNQKLAELAVKIDPKYGWKDIVLTEEKISQLKEICSHVKYRHRVFGQWGFEEKLSHGKGLSVLFSGSPGTGKTMAAEVMARELQLDLYKIDLSGVVSKYIGETEKNLARIFNEAETSNAILFFDEADALFGKRTEVSDAHDRYANIETSFLLQKMEEYEGVVILATNFFKNMDEAFVRRLRFIIEFPFPNEESRLWIWKTHFPAEAPVSKEIDYEFLAGQLPVAGGNIRNIVLSAAFFAARDGGTIGMEHILKGARREFEKIGKLWPHGVGNL
jgi:SpoVK/Ycf46/Vps4 family AAA+-type ATPase